MSPKIMVQNMPGAFRVKSRVLLVGSVSEVELAKRIQEDLRTWGVPCWSLAADDEEALRIDDTALGRAPYYDLLVLVCSGDSLENPHTSRFFSHLVNNGAGRVGQKILPVATDDILYTRQDPLCQSLRQIPALDFRGWREDEAYRRGMAVLAKAMSREDIPTGLPETAATGRR